MSSTLKQQDKSAKYYSITLHFGVIMKHVLLFSILFAFFAVVTEMPARPTKFAECRNGKIIYWTLGNDGAYHSQQTDISCNFKKDVNLSNTHGKIAQPVIATVMNEAEWNQYYQQHMLNIQIVIDEVVPDGTVSVSKTRLNTTKQVISLPSVSASK